MNFFHFFFVLFKTLYWTIPIIYMLTELIFIKFLAFNFHAILVATDINDCCFYVHQNWLIHPPHHKEERIAHSLADNLYQILSYLTNCIYLLKQHIISLIFCISIIHLAYIVYICCNSKRVITCNLNLCSESCPYHLCGRGNPITTFCLYKTRPP